jgi:hypothetical protein
MISKSKMTKWCEERGIGVSKYYPNSNSLRLINGKKMAFRRLQRLWDEVQKEIEKIEVEELRKKLEADLNESDEEIIEIPDDAVIEIEKVDQIEDISNTIQ